MRSSPKIRVNPLATTNSSAANVMPLSSWNAFTLALSSPQPRRDASTSKREPQWPSSPLVGEGWGGGWLKLKSQSSIPPSRFARFARETTSPTRGEVPRARSEMLDAFYSRRLWARGEKPVENLLAGPEQYARPVADRLEHLAEMVAAVRRAHGVGMQHDRHDGGGFGCIGIDLLELIDRALVIFRGLVMLDQHHGDVVTFLRIGHVHDRAGAGLEIHRLVIEHPVADVFVAFLGEEIGRLPGLGQAGTEPAARALAASLEDHLSGLADVFALVLDLLHVALGEAVADELPFALDRRAHDRRISGDR